MKRQFNLYDYLTFFKVHQPFQKINKMVRYLIVLFLILLTNFSFSQVRTITLTQTHADAIKGIDRKAWDGLGNISRNSDGYANDFTLPAIINPCEKITNVKVDVVFTGYSNTSACPHTQTFFNIFYGCSIYAGGATCPIANVISETPYPVNTNPASFNFGTAGFFDFGENLSVDIIPVSTPGCNPVTSGGLTHTYTTTVTVTITDIPLILDILDPAPVCSGALVNIKLPAILKPGSTIGTALTYWRDAAATILLPNPSAINTSGTYYIKSIQGSCSIIKPVVVTIAPPVASPFVTTPINLCVTAPTALIATPSVGNTLRWYGTAATGGTASTVATIPTATGTYFVSQTNGVCESGRVAIQANLVADTGAAFLSLRCDSSFLTPAEINSAVFFDWANDPLSVNDIYSYSYSIQGGPAVTGTIVASSFKVTGMLPGQSATLTLSSSKYPCKPTQIITCKVTCPTPLIKPNFPLITQVYCVGNTMPVLSNTSPTGVVGTWLPPVISNSASGSYTFTPNPILHPCAEPQILSVTVNPIVAPTFLSLPQPTACQNSTGQVLPTSSNDAIPITGTWGPFTSTNTTILGTTIYTFNPSPGQCVSAAPTTLSITVNSSAVPTFNSIPAFCAGTTPIPTLPNSNEGIAGTWSPAVISNTVNGNYQFTPNPILYPCAPIPPLFNVAVTPNITPTFNVSDIQCEGTGIITLPTNSSDVPPISGSWNPTTIDTSILGSNTYDFIPNVGSCVVSATFPKTIEVYTSATPTFNPIADFCAGTPIPSLPDSNEGILGTWNPPTISGNVGTKNYQFTPNISCSPTPLPLAVTVLPSLTPTFSPIIPTDVCEGSMFTLPDFSNDTPPISGSWSTLTVDPIFTIDTSGAGTDSYTFTPDPGQCAITPAPIQITVNPSYTLTAVTSTVTNAFQDNQIITVVATASSGNYLYQLDSGPLQTSPIFENVSAGTHTITVSDANGCSVAKTETDIMVIKHPKFFTPNADGINDTWKIDDLSKISITKIYIFDRFGKLLKELSPDGQGWDGTYIGVPVPADDYWFTVDYVENFSLNKFKSHFSLKR